MARDEAKFAEMCARRAIYPKVKKMYRDSAKAQKLFAKLADVSWAFNLTLNQRLNSGHLTEENEWWLLFVLQKYTHPPLTLTVRWLEKTEKLKKEYEAITGQTLRIKPSKNNPILDRIDELKAQQKARAEAKGEKALRGLT